MIGRGAVTCRGSGCPSAGPEPTPDGPGVLPDVPPSVEELLDAVAAGRTRVVGQSTSTRRYVRKYTRAVRRQLRTGGRAAGNPAR